MIKSNIQFSIKVSGLKKSFNEFIAVAGIDFVVKRGEIFGFLGPNGSGKTTTIRMLLGLLRPTAGNIEVLGIDVLKNPADIRPKVGYMSQKFSLYNDLTVIQNLHFYGKAYGLKNKLLSERVEDSLIMAGLQGREDTKTKDLSGGWRQRLALGASILHRPEILFLDEPTAGVDPISRRVFWDLLYELVRQEITIFVTTHYMDEAEHCHHLAFLQSGSIIAYGSPEEIINRSFLNQVIEITTKNSIESISLLNDLQDSKDLTISNIELYGSLIHVIGSDTGKLKKSIKKIFKKAGIPIEKMTLINPSLEDVFIASMK